jgi:hypothetical protein
MKKLLLRLSAVILSLGMLGAAACSSCSGAPADTGSSDTGASQQTYVCGRGTHKVGNACVADTQATSAQNVGGNTLNTTGNN